MLCHEGKQALYVFLGAVIPFLLVFLGTGAKYVLDTTTAFIVIPLLYLTSLCTILRFIHPKTTYQICLRAAFLGTVFATGVCVATHTAQNVQPFGWYMCIMSTFHFGEFLSISLIQPKLVNVDSFVINHSIHYTIAAISSWLEFGLESYFIPSMKTLHWLSICGVFICIGGELLRKTAMLTAGSNFNHLVQYEKSEEHVLVTHGVYSICRHPSYVGWFYWSIGTQIILLNPLCVIIYAISSWYFFYQRINIEEITLLNFFGQQYCEYQNNIGTGLPFIDGYRI